MFAGLFLKNKQTNTYIYINSNDYDHKLVQSVHNNPNATVSWLFLIQAAQDGCPVRVRCQPYILKLFFGSNLPREAKRRIELKSLYLYDHFYTTFEAFSRSPYWNWWICAFKIFWRPSFVFAAHDRVIERRILKCLFSFAARLTLSTDTKISWGPQFLQANFAKVSDLNHYRKLILHRS